MAVRGIAVLSVISLTWGVLAQGVQASPVPWSNGQWNWTSFATSSGYLPTGQNSPVLTPAIASPTPTAAFTNAGAIPTVTPPTIVTASAPSVAAPETVAPSVAAAPAALTASAAPSTPTGTVDAYLNFGSGPYAEASQLTTGNAQPWYTSSALSSIFGGQPTAAQQQAFVTAVVQNVEQAFQLSGVPLTLTTDPNVPAAHSLSIVSGTTSLFTPNAIGETDIGRNGFDFIDQVAKSASNLGQLEWIVAHNISHELMLAFGVPEVNDTTGNYIDAEKANFSMMINPNATFSAGAVKDLLAQNFLNNNTPLNSPGAQQIDPQAVPEPTTVALWGLCSVGVMVAGRRGRRRAA